MSKLHRAILIDPEARRITELEIEVTVAALHELIGAETLDNFRLAFFDEDRHVDMGWVDDGGLSRGLPIHAFLFPRAKDPVAGKCVIIGANRMGETTSCRIPVEILRQDVTWLGQILPEVTWDETDIASQAIVTYSRVKT
jgi:hypothetical protein